MSEKIKIGDIFYDPGPNELFVVSDIIDRDTYIGEAGKKMRKSDSVYLCIIGEDWYKHSHINPRLFRFSEPCIGNLFD